MCGDFGLVAVHDKVCVRVAEAFFTDGEYLAIFAFHGNNAGPNNFIAVVELNAANALGGTFHEAGVFFIEANSHALLSA